DVWSDLGVLLIVPATSSYLALQFTGASTYTSFSGVTKETRLAVPLIRVAVGLGLAALIIGLV
ncbi:MAG: mercury methylation corrinoid protein HgcA, partial [Syntrophomonadaceae bacterium]